MAQTYTLVDQLRHPRYSWPESLIFLPGEPLAPGQSLVDERGERYAAQNVMLNGENRVAVVTALECGQEKRFEAVDKPCGERLTVEGRADEIALHTDDFALYVPLEGDEVFTIASGRFSAEGVAHIEGAQIVEREVELIEQGDVFADVRVSLLLDGERRYEVTLRVVQGLDYIGMTEEMQGFAADDEVKLRIKWYGLRPTHRNNHYRKTEPVDAYLNDQGKLPMVVAPFDSWVSWWMDKSISFTDGEFSVGAFIWRADLWNDGEYALWRSSNTLAVQFYYAKRQISFLYPLHDGARGTAIAIFSNAREAEQDFGASGDGLYAQSKRSPMDTLYTERLWFWQEFVALNKVQGWTLRWPGNRAAFPRFFPKENIPEAGMDVWYLGQQHTPFTPAQVEKVVYELSSSVNQMIRTGPVSNREFYDWAILFDQAIPSMTERQFDDLRAVFAFCAYAFADENYMPIRKMLAGHPNFLADARGVEAVAAAMFPEHPDARKWKNEFELAMARNLKYHTRPNVRAWDAKGGRWTEDIGCYTFAMLRPMGHAHELLARTFGDQTAVYPNLVMLMEHLVGVVSAPVDGARRFPDVGAHSRGVPANIMDLLVWADAMKRYAPETAEKLYYLGDVNGPSFEENIPGTSMYRSLCKNQPGTRPELKSAKYTGYGFVMRANTYEPDEMNVQLIQIDEGPNYRWGRAAEGCCGMLCYYAAGKQYSGQRWEDAGDWNKNAVQSATNFGVLIDQEFVAVGRNDLTEPLYDFGFAQYAKVNAGEKARRFYRSRSVIMSGNDYITVYDAVADKLVYGRFSWFNKADAPFPNIVQVKPGVGYVESDGGIPIDEPGRQPDHTHRGRYYDGQGDFLTLVSHRPVNSDRGVCTTTRDYGVQVELQGRTDYVFQQATEIHFAQGELAFEGKAGIIRKYGINRVEAAMFDGTDIAAGSVKLHLETDGKAGASFVLKDGALKGMIQADAPVEITLSVGTMVDGYRLGIDSEETNFVRDEDAIRFTAPAGKHTWTWTDQPFEPSVPEITRAVSGAGYVDVRWTAASAATAYRVERSDDGGETWRLVAETNETHCRIELNDRAHIRVRGINGAVSGVPCWDYPVEPTDEPPLAPEGIKVWRQDKAWRVSWGEVPGAVAYRLYRKLDGVEEKCVYEGAERVFMDEQGEYVCISYCVSAVNGNGEGEKSIVRTTQEDGLEKWDPKPGEGFRRYCASHEYGYRGFDYEESYRSIVKDNYPY